MQNLAVAAPRSDKPIVSNISFSLKAGSVLFDGNKAPATIHCEYVEVLLPSLGRAKRGGKAPTRARIRVCSPPGAATLNPNGLLSVWRAVPEPELNHSTVTDLARLRGWSTSVPRTTAV